MERKKLMGPALLSAAISLSLLALPTTQALADGSQTLGPPSITILSGTDIVAKGTGMLSQPGLIDISIPAGATVNQVILYWEGVSIPPAIPDDTINIGGIDVTGANIGTSVIKPDGTEFNTFRADITGLGQVSPGNNSLSLSDMDFSRANNGAGVMVIIDDGVAESEIVLRDGDDWAYILSNMPDGTVAVAQDFNFAPEAVNRTGELDMFFGSVSGSASGGAFRPSAIDVTVDGVITTHDNLLDSHDGDEWDTIVLPVEIPAGVSLITVQPHSVDNLGLGETPASFSWIAAGLSVPVTPPPPGGGQGCTPGYWKQSHHFDSWVGFTPGQMFNTVFEDAFPGKTLLDVLKQGGGGVKALGRHTVAALLNSSNGDVDYDVSTAGIIDSFNNVFPGGDYEGLKDIYADFNEQGCSIN